VHAAGTAGEGEVGDVAVEVALRAACDVEPDRHRLAEDRAELDVRLLAQQRHAVLVQPAQVLTALHRGEQQHVRPERRADRHLASVLGELGHAGFPVI